MRNRFSTSRWKIWGRVLLISALLGSAAVRADMAQTHQEIAHLLAHIAASDCRFIRNGKSYDAQAAREHIQKKYDYIQSRVRTTEDFIRYAASKSSMSGKPYRIACGDRTMLCADWLREELERLRRQAADPHQPQTYTDD